MVRKQVGDMTFQEAYEKTRKVLNVIIPFEGEKRSVLMNFLTTPNVIVWTAGVASNSQGSFPGLWGDVGILCKDDRGEIVPWGSDGISLSNSNTVGQVPYTSSLDTACLEKFSSNYISNCRDQPFARISASFNTNHFILSRPYPSIPFLTSSLSPSAAPQSTLAHLLSLELSHRISQLDSIGLIPSRVRRLLGGERVPAEIVVVPRLGWKDLFILGRYLLGIPGNTAHQWTLAQGAEGYFDSVAQDFGAGWEEWIFRGERGVGGVGGYIRAKWGGEITFDHFLSWGCC